MLVLALFSLLAAAQQIPLPPLPPPPEPVPSTSPTLQGRVLQVLPQIEALKNIGGTAGISIGVMTHGHVVLDTNLGFSNVDHRLTADSSTRYPIASLTKAFVTSTIVQVVNEGLIKRDGEQPLALLDTTSSTPWAFAKVVTPAQFGKIGLNSILMDATPVIGA